MTSVPKIRCKTQLKRLTGANSFVFVPNVFFSVFVLIKSARFVLYDFGIFLFCPRLQDLLFMLPVTFCADHICKICSLCLVWLFVQFTFARFVVYASCNFLCCSHLQDLFFMPRVTLFAVHIYKNAQEHTNKSDMQVLTAQMRTNKLRCATWARQSKESNKATVHAQQTLQQ